MDFLTRYVSLERSRLNLNFDFQIDYSNISTEEDITIPPMIIQPIVENAIIHGLVPSKEKGFLKIEFEERNNVLTILIEDNGVGRHVKSNKEKSADHKSMATDITNQRVLLIAKRFKKNISMQTIDLFDTDNKPAGTRVIFKIDTN